MQLRTLTSHHDGSGLLGRVSHIVAGHASVDPRLVWGDGWKRKRAALHHTSLRQAVISADPGENGGRLTSGSDANQGYRLSRVHHNRILHQQFDGWRGCRKRECGIDDRPEEDGQLWQLWQLQNNSTEKLLSSSSSLSIRFVYYIVLRFSGVIILAVIYFLCPKVNRDAAYLSCWWV